MSVRASAIACFVGGGVGDTVAVELLEAVSAAGGPVFLEAFARC